MTFDLHGYDATAENYRKAAMALSDASDIVENDKDAKTKSASLYGETCYEALDKRMFEICLDNVYRQNLPIAVRYHRRVPDGTEFAKISEYMRKNYSMMGEYEAAVLYALFGMTFFN